MLRGHIGLSLCGCPSVTLCIRSRAVRNRILKFDKWNLSFPSDFSLQSYAPFSTFFYFAIISLWNLLNKISGEPLGLGS